jgi:hypothetical protein
MRPTRFLLLFFLSLTANLPLRAGYTAAGFNATQKILYVGDSLTVGPFGRELQNFLCDQFGEGRVYLYASCGASPESWLDGEASYISRCGCRVKTPALFMVREFEKGVAPEPFATPKLTPLLAQVRPSVVIVQLGTNWFDLLEQHPGPEEMARLDAFLDRFVDTIQNAPGRPSLLWITPPDSARFRSVQTSVTQLLLATGKRKRFAVINSSSMVRYEPGLSGGDGVHYYGADAMKWADGVKKRLLSLL